MPHRNNVVEIDITYGTHNLVLQTCIIIKNYIDIMVTIVR